jgi:hypothetical protein
MDLIRTTPPRPPPPPPPPPPRNCVFDVCLEAYECAGLGDGEQPVLEFVVREHVQTGFPLVSGSIYGVNFCHFLISTVKLDGWHRVDTRVDPHVVRVLATMVHVQVVCIISPN